MVARCLPLAVLFLFGNVIAHAVAVKSEFVAEGFTKPVFLCSPPGDTTRIMVVEQGGKIKLIKNGTVRTTAFLDIASKVNQGGDERGLLGLAFHPNYATNGYFYVYYIDTTYPGNTKVERYSVTSDRDIADPNSGFNLLSVAHPDTNHKGGWIGFSPTNGYLYVAIGDGGGANDPSGNGQNVNTKLGKILRLDVDIASPYAPSTNPFYGATNGDDLIWAYGLRNPYRCSFDRSTGDLWMGDVGQDTLEEIDFYSAGSAGGKNYGWKTAEGFECRGGGGTCGTNAGFTPPVIDYPRTDGVAVVGGYVYRGTAIAGLQGTYFYADYVFGGLWSLKYNGSTVTEQVDRDAELNPAGWRSINNPSSFGEDASGELYICDYADGEIYKIAAVVTASDTDGDGLIDTLETTLGTNPNDSDSDDDGLTDGVEVNTHLTDPLDSDSDNDNLSDGVEVNTHGTNPKKSDTDNDGLSDGTEINTHTTDPKKSDTDGDGLSDGAEINTHATNPKDTDSDDDGLSDGAEVNTHTTNPKDSDSDDDGLSDGVEVNTHTTSPKDSDSDDDGIFDGVEVNTHGTNPKKADTDNDGMTDGAEINTYGTDPKKSDTDSDGLNDGAEITTHATDPKKADTDGDALTDGAEINTHGTNPKKSDTDGDGLNDGSEINTHKTDPKKSDTDGDGLSDGNEVNTRGTDPKKSDTDGDGLSDGAEVTTHQTNALDSDSDDDTLSDGAEVNTHATNPKKADTDDDGLNDGAEINTHGTNPKKADTDNDSLSDGDEVTTHATNPKDADSDNDGLGDGEEITDYLTDPLDNDSDNDSLQDGEEINEYGTDPNAPDVLVLNKPFEGDVYEIGNKANIRWTTLGAAGELVRIELWQRGEFVRVVKAQSDNDGKLKWKLPKNLEPGTGYQFYIQSVTVPAIDDIANNSFTIVAAPAE
ncbi:MAG: PQQ-dependent sugar dehydrogenase [Candidatus Hydrogenedentes bacterium]|nr:PQQ-dependent sugar dehydrogenase [Candidatus Hydrogenedentota bacterium]